MITKKIYINSMEDLKAYYNKKLNAYYFSRKEGEFLKVIFTFDVKTDKNIYETAGAFIIFSVENITANNIIIGTIYSSGEIIAKGSIESTGEIIANGNISSDKYIHGYSIKAKGNICAKEYISAYDELYSEKNISSNEYIYSTNLHAKGEISGNILDNLPNSSNNLRENPIKLKIYDIIWFVLLYCVIILTMISLKINLLIALFPILFLYIGKIIDKLQPNVCKRASEYLILGFLSMLICSIICCINQMGMDVISEVLYEKLYRFNFTI